MVAQLVETILKQNQDRTPKNPPRHSIANSLDHRSSEECQIWPPIEKNACQEGWKFVSGVIFFVFTIK